MSQISHHKKRNSKLDMLRGHYLVAILVDHVSYYGGISLFTFYNGNGRLWTSAAEGFIFLSGFFVSYVYYPKMIDDSAKRVFKSLWRRAITLYIWSVALTLVYVALTLGLGKFPGPTGFINYDSYSNLLVDTMLLRFSYGWADLLPLYVLLLLTAPIILYLFKRNLSVIVLLTSFLLWFTNLYEIECVRFCVSFFDLSSWQFMFVLGMFTAAHKNVFRVYTLSNFRVGVPLLERCFVLTGIKCFSQIFWIFSRQSKIT